MIPAIQREALAVLAELCDLSSEDIRLGQLLALIELLGSDETGRSLWNIEDDEFLAILNVHKAQLLARLPESQQQAFRLSGGSASMVQSSAIPEANPPVDVGS